MQTGEFTPLLSASSLVAGQVPFKKTLGLLLEYCVCWGDYLPVYSLLWVAAAELLLMLAFTLCLKMAPRGRQSRKYAGLIRYPENSSGSRSTKRGARAGTCMPHGELLFPSMEPPCFSPIFVVWSLSHIRICNPEEDSDHGILQARILEWVAISFCRGSSRIFQG